MQGMASDEFVERVRERSDIFSVVSHYVQLTQKSGRYWGCCPFHNEKTASFTVSPDKGLFYCFGCGAGGDVFKFLSLIENVSYFEAIKLQAQRLGIDLPTFARRRTSSSRRKNSAQDKRIGAGFLSRLFNQDGSRRSRQEISCGAWNYAGDD